MSDIVIDEFETLLEANNVESNYVLQLFDYYHQRLMEQHELLEVLERYDISIDDCRSKRLAYCDRTLNRLFEQSRTADGGACRGCFKRLGLIKYSGHELFRGCFVEPLFVRNDIVSAFGVKLDKRIVKHAATSIYWYRDHVYRDMPNPLLKRAGELL